MPEEEIFRRSDGVEVPLVPRPYCEFCSKPIQDKYADWGRCHDCYRLTNEKLEVGLREGTLQFTSLYPFDFVLAGAIGLYVTEKKEGILYNEIWKLKKGPDGAEETAPLLAECLEHVIRTRYPSMLEAEIIVPAPPGEKDRGFNQSSVLGMQLQSRMPGFQFSDVLLTTEDYKSQRKVSDGKERWNNPRGKIFVAPEKRVDIVERIVLLVDDTLVTGSTANECAKVLRAEGSKRVFVAVVGRAVSPGDLEFIEYSGRF